MGNKRKWILLVVSLVFIAAAIGFGLDANYYERRTWVTDWGKVTLAGVFAVGGVVGILYFIAGPRS